MLSSDAIHQMSETQLREFAHRLMQQLADQSKQLDQFSSDIAQRDQALAAKDQLIDSKEQRIRMLTHEIAVLKRWKRAGPNF